MPVPLNSCLPRCVPCCAGGNPEISSPIFSASCVYSPILKLYQWQLPVCSYLTVSADPLSRQTVMTSGFRRCSFQKLRMKHRTMRKYLLIPGLSSRRSRRSHFRATSRHSCGSEAATRGRAYSAASERLMPVSPEHSRFHSSMRLRSQSGLPAERGWPR